MPTSLPDDAIATLAPFASERDLREMRLLVGRPWQWWPSLFGMSATTLGHFVLVRADRYNPATPRGLALIAHESMHIGQYRELGIPRFLARYLWLNIRCRFRHDRHPLEIPCITLQRQVRAALTSATPPGSGGPGSE